MQIKISVSDFFRVEKKRMKLWYKEIGNRLGITGSGVCEQFNHPEYIRAWQLAKLQELFGWSDEQTLQIMREIGEDKND